ncbi:hypothetical protein IWX76_002698 [Pedobacter sp. CAN_A7]|uniref:hypothetical protein n=1 Tax=Pedobacter sp. CAN_A7 TaxID=2787722 RepID=UPI0018CA0C00
MDTLDDLRGDWKRGRDLGAPLLPLKNSELKDWIKGSMKKEQQLVFRYAVKTFIWSLLVFSFLTYLMLRFWGDWNLFVVCMAAMAIYIPFTAVFMKHYKRFFAVECGVQQEVDLKQGLHIKFMALKQFYSVKKIFDWLMVPLSCAVIALTVNKYAFDAPFIEHLGFNIITFILYSTAFIYVTRKDNTTYFKVPMKKMETVMREMEDD